MYWIELQKIENQYDPEIMYLNDIEMKHDGMVICLWFWCHPSSPSKVISVQSGLF